MKKIQKSTHFFLDYHRAVLPKACKIIYKWTLAKSKKVQESWEYQYSALFFKIVKFHL
jgi:hypothetical protein